MIVGVGSELVSLEGLKKRELQMAKKILLEDEYKIYNKKINHLEFLAGIMAAKGAVYKALPSSKNKDVYKLEIKIDEKKAYYEDENYYVFVSISSDKNYAIASATAISKE